MRITSTGNVGIGRTSPTYKLDVAGQIRATSGFITSDMRFKKDIEALDDCSQKLSQLSGVTYTYRTDEFQDWSFSREKQIGFLAQDVQKIFPELVNSDADGYLNVNYVGLIPVIVETLKEQQKVIEAKDNQIKTLEERLLALEKAVEMNPKNTGFTKSKLYQNNPNPSGQATNISFDIPTSANQAILFVHDMQGRQVKKIEITQRNHSTITIKSNELKAGIYTYSLVVDGQMVDTLKMILAE